MPPKRDRNRISPALRAFGNALKRIRESTGLSQDQAGAKVPVSGSYIGMVEQGKTRCRREMAVTLDKALGANGILVTLWDDLVMDAAYPTWFDWPTIEGQATHLQTYQCLVMPGLLQHEDYARALLGGDEEAVKARLSRAEILTRKDPEPPRLTVVLAETVLYHQVGGKETMRAQLEHLLAAPQELVTVQILTGPLHPGGVLGAFAIATLEDRTEVAYVETAARGLTMGETEDIRALSDAFDRIRSRVLPVDQSRDLIRKVMEERWT
ncbi:XRE family transcriptional regulator [Actinomadura craniellae]|uniref:XRE family transcriptional regulator n=1 Tax=Actinomadura craniellae TaxID=2231787 RepID=A0A365H2K8_9ACTN|nr:helix-turn-helix transcriptional regulator [Actinomadura craniellae]RAY13222.1 XRE family transcriptional regulator [Actinomadura craniellae]